MSHLVRFVFSHIHSSRLIVSIVSTRFGYRLAYKYAPVHCGPGDNWYWEDVFICS